LYGFVRFWYGHFRTWTVLGPYLGAVWGTALAVLGTVLGIWPKYGSPPSDMTALPLSFKIYIYLNHG
jgi:hypothetical protein